MITANAAIATGLCEATAAGISVILIVWTATVGVAITGVDATGIVGATRLVNATRGIAIAIGDTAAIAMFLAGFAFSCQSRRVKQEKRRANEYPSGFHRKDPGVVVNV